MSEVTILIAEDDEFSRKLVQAVLRPHGYRLLVADDGQQAVEIATRERPDLILMDMRLPELDGYDATRMLKSQPETASIPIVAMTAHALEEERQKAEQAGCDGYVTKPIDTRSFPDQIKKHLAEE